MREIKFRGKTKEGVWVYGYYLPWHSVKDMTGKDVYAQIFEEKDEKHPKGWANVIASTIGQFTGLHDKKGEEIYEGDILQMEDRIVQVLWHEKAACWDCNFITYIAEPDRDFSLKGLGKASWWKMYQVIGNIYDNPELIKE